jgi:uncharacterized protein
VTVFAGFGGTHDERVAAFLLAACPDFRIGDWRRAALPLTAARMLARHPEIAHDSIVTAAVSGDLAHVERILAERPEAASAPGGPRAMPPLLYVCTARVAHAASAQHAVAIARALLDRGADPNAFHEGGDSTIHYTALTCVVGRGEEQASVHPQARALAALLLERGAEPYDVQVLYNAFAGHASHRHLADDDLVWLLDLMYTHSVRRGRKADWDDPELRMLNMGGFGSGAWYLLSSALSGNHLRMAEWLLSHGANPNAQPAADQGTPKGTLCDQAVGDGLTDLAALLVQYGASQAPPAFEGAEAFAAACLAMNRGLVEALAKEHPEYLQDPRALFTAAERNRADVLGMLLDLGASPNLEHPRQGQTRPLHAAAYYDSPDAAALLVERGAEIDPRDLTHGGTPIWWALWGQKPRMVKFLSPLSRDVWALALSGDVRRLREVLDTAPRLATDFDGDETPLFYLPDDEQRAAEVVELLLAHGADPSIRNKAGLTAAQVALRRGLDAAATNLRTAER